MLGALAGLLPAEAQAGRRIALVIGNADYKIGRLANPVSDAKAIAEVLERQLKLDKVILKTNLTAEGLRAALREMGRESAGAELGLIYFAGHGIDVGGRNFLIPVDATLETARDVRLEAIELDTVLEHLDGVTKLRLVILDACRNNPFPAGKRGGTRGLGRIEPVGGTLVAYAAKDGTTADDGAAGRHSPFTASLLKRIVMPGVDMRRVFGYVSEDVLTATARVQEPYLYGRLGGDEVYLLPKKGADPAGVTPGLSSLVLPPSPADLAWTAVKDSDDIPALETFRQHYGKERPVYDRLAALRIEALKDRKRAAEEKKADADALRPGRVFRDCAEVCPEMVVVPAGSFMMGLSPAEIDALMKEIPADYLRRAGPVRQVTIARPLAVGKFEITFAEWDACVAGGDCTHRPDDKAWGRGKRPVINVSWNDVTNQYLQWLSRKAGKSYRLLSEAEWEYAARAGTTTRYAFGDTISRSQARFSDGYGGSAGKTVEVGSFQPNAFGLYDMHGNVWEWVQDCLNNSYNGAPSDGTAWTTAGCPRRVFRGGSWFNDGPGWLRPDYRASETPDDRDDSRGFRVARTL